MGQRRFKPHDVGLSSFLRVLPFWLDQKENRHSKGQEKTSACVQGLEALQHVEMPGQTIQKGPPSLHLVLSPFRVWKLECIQRSLPP